MRSYLTFAFTIILFLGVAQTPTDFDLLVENVSKSATKQKEANFKGLLKVYNRAITDQIINDCIYQQSCSNFGQHSFENYGMIKGLFVTYDRLTRCNRLSQIHVLPVRVNKEGKIDDPSDWYKK